MAMKKSEAAGGQALVIVESPAKARTIGKYLGKGFRVEASIGHVRDLPQGAKQVPAQYKGQSWANLGVNVDENFTPIYIVPPGKTKQIKLLKDELKNSNALYLATDEDREGEAISWHLLELLKPKVPVHRLVFHEITKDAIQAALAEPHSGPTVRLRGVSAALAQGAAQALGGPRAERGHPAHRRARTRTHGVRLRDVVGPARAVREDQRRTA
jgi:DNA topoisomerase IA